MNKIEGWDSSRSIVNEPISVPAAATEDSRQRRELVQAVRRLNKTDYLMVGERNELQVSFDKTTRRPVVTVVNRDSHEVVSQMPPEYVLNVARELQEQEQRNARLRE